MRRTAKYLLLSLAAISVGQTISAQYDQEIISVGDRTLTVDNAFKIDELPSTIDSVPQAANITYRVIPRQIEVNYAPKQIKAANLRLQEPLAKLYRGYAKAGIGLYVTPLIDVRYNSIRNRDWNYGISAQHFSSQGGIPKLAESAFSENHAGFFAKKYISKHTVEAGLNYNRDAIHYYGFDLGDSKLAKDKYKQSFSTIAGHAEVMSHYSDSTQIQHRIRVDYRNMTDKFKGREGNFLLSAEGSKTQDENRYELLFQVDANSLSMAQPNSIFVDTVLNITPIPDLTTKGGIIRLEPTIHTKRGALTADVGLGFAFETGDPESLGHIYPKAFVSYSLFNDLFTPYAGLTGSLKRNSYYSLSQDNPFITHFSKLKNTSEDFTFYGGITGTILDNIGFNAKVSYTSYADVPLYINDVLYSAENRFNVIYEDMKVFNVMGELNYVYNKKLSVMARLELIKYNMRTQERAWNLPGTKVTLDARYDLDDRFVVKLQMFAQGRRYARATKRTGILSPGSDLSELQPIAMRAFVDGSLALEYRYTKRISAFIEMNNFSGGRYQRFYRYPIQSVMLLGGLTYSF